MSKKKQKQQQRQKAAQRRAQKTKKRNNIKSPKPAKPITVLETEDFSMGTFEGLDQAGLLRHFETITLNSHVWINEPEFTETVIINPLLALEAFMAFEQETGISLEQTIDLSEEEQQDHAQKMREALLKSLLNDETCAAILEAVDALADRWQQTPGKPAQAVQALHIFLSKDTRMENWQMIGLVHALVERALENGFDFATGMSGLMDKENEETIANVSWNNFQDLLDTPAFADLLHKAKTSPAFQTFLAEQADKMIDDGDLAMAKGELQLSLFSAEEVMAFAEQIEQNYSTLATDDVGAVRNELVSYVNGLMSPARLDQMRQDLTAQLEQKAYDSQWHGYLFWAEDALKKEEALEMCARFLYSAFMGQFSGVVKEVATAGA